MRLAAVSVDLDEIPNYFNIHGLPPPEGDAKDAVYDLALERLDRFARAHDLPLTLFVIGGDVARPQNAERLRALAAAGHELGNHSRDHLYDLTRRSRMEMARQVRHAADAIERSCGQRPIGFRAPGYTVTDELFEVLADCDVRYDSSVFPSPAYYLAKAAALAGIRLRRRRSQSLLDTPAVLRAPLEPYSVGKPYWTRGGGLLELPIQVTSGLRLPYIGTALTLAGPERARWLTRGVLGSKLVNLELHGIDVLDAADGLEALRRHQPDVRVAHARKLEALSAAITLLRESGYAFVRLDEAASQFAARL